MVASWERWLRLHAQRIGIALIVATLAAALVAGAIGALRLRDARDLERRIVRTQQLQSAVLEIQVAEERGSSEQRNTAKAEASQAFADLARHDPTTAQRLRPAYTAVVASATNGATRRLVTAIQAELAQDSRQTQITNPSTRSALIATAAATLLLILELAWQFELARRAGRIDRDLAARAEELARMRSSLVGLVSHELRTPLTSIVGYLELLDERETGPLTDEQSTYLASARRSADRLVSLVDDLLTLTEAGALLALETRTVDIAALVRESVTAARPAADARSIELNAELDGAGQIVGDRRRLGQMLDNLVSNAVKFTPAGGTVTVRARRYAHGVAFEVADTGVGISEDERAQLFDPFFRSRHATAKAIPGTGLGLTITKAIVDAHGGTIEVETTPGGGATFRVRIPAGLELTASRGSREDAHAPAAAQPAADTS